MKQIDKVDNSVLHDDDRNPLRHVTTMKSQRRQSHNRSDLRIVRDKKAELKMNTYQC